MRRPSALQIAVAAVIAVAVTLAALTHTHTHASAQRGGGTVCTYCENPPALMVGAGALGAPVLTRLCSILLLPSQPDRIVVLEHPARGPPRL